MNEIAVARRKNRALFANSDLEAATDDVRGLGVRMMVCLTDCSLLEAYFDHHQVLVVAQYLSLDTNSGYLPYEAGSRKK